MSMAILGNAGLIATWRIAEIRNREATPQHLHDMGAVLRNDLPVPEYQRHKEGK